MLLITLDTAPPTPFALPESCAIAPDSAALQTHAEGAIAPPCQPTPETLGRVEGSVRDRPTAQPLITPATPERHLTTEWAAPTPHPLLKLGSRGSAVRQLQGQLQQQGYSTDGIDGVYGRRTQAAVRTLQRDRGLAVDGIAGPATWAALNAPSTNSGFDTRGFTTAEGVEQLLEEGDRPQSTTLKAGDTPVETAPAATIDSTDPDGVALTADPEVTSSAMADGDPLEVRNPPTLLEPAPQPWLWGVIVGWLIFYGSGWGWIIRTGLQSQRGIPTNSAAGRPLQRRATAQATSSQPQTADVVGGEEAAGGEEGRSPQALSTVPAIQAIPTSHNPQSTGLPLEEPQAVVDTAENPAPAAELAPEALPIPFAETEHLEPSIQLFDHFSEVDDTRHQDEQVVAVLPETATDLNEETFHYSLVDWAEDLFVLYGNELRVLKSRLDRYGGRVNKTVTIRRTSNKGHYEDQSFNLTIETAA